MKKLFLIIFIITATAGITFAQNINLGDFPLGNWIDPNYNAVWELASDNIRILSPSGKVYCDFSKKTVNDFKFQVEGGKPTITFSSPETKRSYKFIKALTNMNIILEINAPWDPDYKVEMKKK